MKIKEIMDYPEIVDNVHESVYRSFQILEKVKYYLSKNVPPEIVLEIIEEMQNNYLTNRT